MEHNTRSNLLGNLIESETNNDHSFTGLLNYFESRYGADTERTNYVDVILSMKKETMISALVKTYNKVLKKILLIYYSKEEDIPYYWVQFMTNDQQWLWDELKAFLNEQIKRIFDETPYSDKFAIECITNLRPARNESLVRTHIASKSSEDVIVLINEITDCKEIVYDAPKHMSHNNTKTNDYIDYRSQYIEAIVFLIKNGYCKGYNDIFFEKDAGVSYIANNTDLIKRILLIVFVLCILVAFICLVEKLGFFGIIILIGLPGALLSMMMKGK